MFTATLTAAAILFSAPAGATYAPDAPPATDSPMCSVEVGVVDECWTPPADAPVADAPAPAVEAPAPTVAESPVVEAPVAAAPAPAPVAEAPSVVDLPDGTSVAVPAAEPYSFSFTDLLEALRDLFGGFLGRLLGL